MGAQVGKLGQVIASERPQRPLRPLDLTVPGDISSAAFLLAAGLLAPRRPHHVGRRGRQPDAHRHLDILQAMGADLRLENQREEAGEPVADIVVQPARLHGVEIGGDLIPRADRRVPGDRRAGDPGARPHRRARRRRAARQGDRPHRDRGGGAAHAGRADRGAARRLRHRRTDRTAQRARQQPRRPSTGHGAGRRRPGRQRPRPRRGRRAASPTASPASSGCCRRWAAEMDESSIELSIHCRSHRLAARTQRQPGDAQRGVPGAGAGRALRRAAGRRRRTVEALVRSLPARGYSRRQRDDPAQAGRHAADGRAERRRAAHRRGQHDHRRTIFQIVSGQATGNDLENRSTVCTATTPTGWGFCTRWTRVGSTWRASQPCCWARAARRAPWPMHWRSAASPAWPSGIAISDRAAELASHVAALFPAMTIHQFTNSPLTISASSLPI